MSLREAFDSIGYAPCYHMSTILFSPDGPKHIEFWKSVGNGGVSFRFLITTLA